MAAAFLYRLGVRSLETVRGGRVNWDVSWSVLWKSSCSKKREGQGTDCGDGFSLPLRCVLIRDRAL